MSGNLRRPLTFASLVLVRLSRRRASSLALLFGFAMLVALFDTEGLLQFFSGEAGLHSTLQHLGASRNVVLSLSGIRESPEFTRSHESMPRDAIYTSFVRSGDGTVQSTLGPRLHFGARFVESEQLLPRASPAGATAAGLASVVADGDLLPHVQVVEGTLPVAQQTAQAWNATVATPAARALDLHVGRTYCFATLDGRAGPCLRIAAVWTPRVGDPYWEARPIPTSSVSVNEQAFFALLHTLPATFAATGHIVYAPDLAQVREANLPDLLARFRQLRTAVTTIGGVQVATGLDGALQAFAAKRQASRFPIQLVGTQVLLLAVFQVAFIASRALDQQSELLGVWRSRGWSWQSLWRMLVLEALVLLAPAALLGLVAASIASIALTRWTYAWDPDGLLADAAVRVAGWTVAGLAVSIAIVAMLAARASRQRLLEVHRRASRPALRGWWQWRFADLGLAALAVPLLLTTQVLGGAQLRALGAVGDDPLSPALPGLALLGIALALLRLLPLTALAVRLSGRGTSRLIASIELGRRPFQHGPLALLVMVTAALGTFAGAYATSAVRGAADGAAYSVGSDIRVHFGQPPVLLPDVLRGLGGVQGASLVYRASGQAGTSSFRPTVLGVDPYSLRNVVWARPDLAQRPLSDLVQELADREQGGLLLPGRPDHAGVWAYSTGLQAQLTVEAADAAGRPGEARLGSLAFTGWRYLEAPLTMVARPVRYPLRFRDLALEPQAGGMPGGGQLGLSQLGAGGATRSSRTVVEPFRGWPEGLPGWWQTPAPASGDPQLVAPAGFVHEDAPAVRLDVDAGSGLVLFRPPPSLYPVPALVPQATLERNGLHVGQRFDLTVNSVDVQFVVTDSVEHFPTLYPEAEDFVVAAQAPLLAWVARRGGDQVWPGEAWLKASPADQEADAQALRGSPAIDSVDDRQSLEAAAMQDPAVRELQADLIVAAVVALALTVVASAMHFMLTSRERLAEYAILQANGLGRQAIGRSFTLEQALVFAFGLALGTGLGFGLGWMLIPALQLGGGLMATVPGTVVSVDPALAVAGLGAAATLGLAAGWLAGRFGTGFRLMDELRSL